MIELFTADTPNGKKISVMLEEIGYKYKVTKVDIYNSEQFKSEFKNPQSFEEKNKVNMSKTSSNRGWGGIKAEQVNSDFNPDNKEIFDCGPNINIEHKFQDLPYYSKNIWPDKMPLFEKIETLRTEFKNWPRSIFNLFGFSFGMTAS